MYKDQFGTEIKTYEDYVNQESGSAYDCYKAGKWESRGDITLEDRNNINNCDK